MKLPCTSLLRIVFVALVWVVRAWAADGSENPVKQYVRDTWGVREGLPQSAIAAILQTRDGYLWLSTHEGLVRFNGHQFKVFNETNVPELRSNVIGALLEDRQDGSLWIAT
ncbi:MAG TPA: two-component regulator propeller domain-containing protein, partial [Candidatus Angelobacter sp.]|nr:two-component regulator propeller domain-containing protein [Candidatus Angelobacter sp.]